MSIAAVTCLLFSPVRPGSVLVVRLHWKVLSRLRLSQAGHFMIEAQLQQAYLLQVGSHIPSRGRLGRPLPHGAGACSPHAGAHGA